eukprot:2354215-Prymnesium_polylepis.3
MAVAILSRPSTASARVRRDSLLLPRAASRGGRVDGGEFDCDCPRVRVREGAGWRTRLHTWPRQAVKREPTRPVVPTSRLARDRSL